MKILLAPSETKRPEGEGSFDPCALLFEELCPLRQELLEIYRQILRRGDPEELRELFGLKKADQIARYAHLDPLESGTMKAVLRYDGVAFEYLDFLSLDGEAQVYLEERLLIFSNLFGPLRAGDPIPDYRLKQGGTLGGIRPEQRYRELSTPLLDDLLGEGEILDLRAGFYDRFYKPAAPYTTLKFLKGGKVVSHWAKAWRGKVVRQMALHRIASIEELLALPMEGLQLLEIQSRGKRTEILYEVE
ncbi:YaaA family protein [Nitratifractor sp.]